MQFLVSYAVGPLNSKIGKRKLASTIVPPDQLPTDSKSLWQLEEGIFKSKHHYEFHLGGNGSLDVIAVSPLPSAAAH